MTATRAALLALADRCEQASGPDREIDFSIFRALHPEYAGPEWKPYGNGLRHINDSSDMRCLPAPEMTPPRWTASLDAALPHRRSIAGLDTTGGRMSFEAFLWFLWVSGISCGF